MDIEIKDKQEIDLDEYFPVVSKELLGALKDKLDIRKVIKYNPSIDYLKGIQDTIDFLELKFKEQNNTEN